MKKNLLVYIIILNWKNYRHTINCYKTCQSLSYPNFKILIVDNNSPNQSEDRIRQCLTGVEILQTGNNLGYAGGNNLGVKYALDKNADFIWILNPDVEVEKDSLSYLMTFVEKNPEVGICGPRISHGGKSNSFIFDGLSIDSSDGYQSRFNLSGLLAETEDSSCLEVDCVSGCSMLIRSAVFSSVGLLREDFFHYYEDVDICYRAREYGWRTCIFKPAEVAHARHKMRVTELIGFYNERNRILFSRIKDNKQIPKFVTKRNRSIIIHHLKRLNIPLVFVFLVMIFFAALSGLNKRIKLIPTLSLFLLCGCSSSKI